MKTDLYEIHGEIFKVEYDGERSDVFHLNIKLGGKYWELVTCSAAYSPPKVLAQEGHKIWNSLKNNYLDTVNYGGSE